MKVWLQVRKDLQTNPMVEGLIGGTSPLYFERYFFRGVDRAVNGMGVTGLVIQFGGARVTEGGVDLVRGQALPGQILLIPPRCATRWHYSGFVDFGVFYFPHHVDGLLLRVQQLAEMRDAPLSLVDALVSAAAMAIAEEIAKGPGRDEHFVETLVGVMLERMFRVATSAPTLYLSPRHTHFDRLHTVLNHVRANLASDLSLESLADLAKVSVPHFQRLFHDAMGVSVHKFVLSARLEQARKLLTTTRMPLSRIADECGFCNQSHLAKCFRTVHAATPSEFRNMVKRVASHDTA